MPADDELLPTTQAARTVGIHPRTLQQWVRDGLIEPTRVTASGHARWDPDDLDSKLRALRQRDR